MAAETVAQCDWLGFLTNGTLIPASAFVAICLFIIRELMDSYRKSKTKKNEIRALKTIFARECQLAWYINGQIKELCEEFAPYEKIPMREHPLSFSVSKTAAGKIRYVVTENDNPLSYGLLSKPSVATFTKHLYDLSKLDSVFYEKVNLAYTAVIELKHFYDSLVDNEDTSRLIGINNIMYGFASYALEEIEWIESELKNLYQYCTGNELTRGLLR